MGLTNHEKFKLTQLQAKKAQKTAALAPFQTFVNVENGNNKFWKISVPMYDRLNGYTVITQYGALDTEGVELRKQFGHQYADACKYRSNKIVEKRNKGYEELV